jgi:hypothetical protein
MLNFQPKLLCTILRIKLKYKVCYFCLGSVYYPSSAVYNIRNHDDTVSMGKLIEEETNKD